MPIWHTDRQYIIFILASYIGVMETEEWIDGIFHIATALFVLYKFILGSIEYRQVLWMEGDRNVLELHTNSESYEKESIDLVK